MTLTQPQPRRSIGAAIGLFFLAPIVAEYLLGDLPITLLVALVMLAPFYGGGALLIRELARRTSRGWPSIALLGIAYGLFEEGFTTQSLFNPNYMGKNFHLLDPGYIPALGIGAWWTLFVLTLHAAWSICASIALTESLVPSRRTTPWLGNVGLVIVALLFAAGAAAGAARSYRQDHFLSSKAQFASAGIVILVLVVAAFRLPRSHPASDSASGTANGAGFVPPAWLTGAIALVLASGVLLVPPHWGWGAAASVFALDAAAVILILAWSRSARWTPLHRLALGAGAVLAYAWHSFVTVPLVGAQQITVVRAGKVAFTLLAIVLIAVAARRTARAAHEPATAV
jgi:hypothetical protein